jgi:PilZ domain
MALLDTVFRYRTLLGKCELGIGLSFDEIDEMCSVEALFASADRGYSPARRYRRSAVAMTALIRGDKYHDLVKVVVLGAGGLECRGAPFIEEGSHVELFLDVGDHSYRFCARAVWMRDDGNDYRVAFAFEGIPVLVQSLQTSKVDSITASTSVISTGFERVSAAA